MRTKWGQRIGGSWLGILAAVVLLSAALPGALAAQEPWVAATGAAVMDFETGEFYYEKDADLARPAASMTKVMSMYLILEEIGEGRLSLDSYVTAGSWAAAVSNNPSYSGLERLRAGNSYRVEDLLRLIMTESCNGSVIVLAEYIGGTEEAFVQRMNDRAEQWGIDAHFADVCGFEDKGNAVSPRAMAYMAQRIIADHPEILNYSSLRETTFQGRVFSSTNTLLRNGTVEGIDGLKTGTTNGAGYCFTGTAQREGRRIISVVMNSTGYAARMADSQRLLEYGFACRTEREAAWTVAAQSLSAEIGARTPLWAQAEGRLGATLSGLSAEAWGAAHWEVNGEKVEGSDQSLWLKNGAEVETGALIPSGEGPVQATLVVTLPDGTVLRQEAELERTEEEVSFTGRLGARRLELYPETMVDVPFQVRCDQDTWVTVPAGWYLDGEPIPEYQNPAFRVGPEGRRSQCGVFADTLSPGEHILEFCLNPGGLSGVERTVFSTQLLILDGETA